MNNNNSTGGEFIGRRKYKPHINEQLLMFKKNNYIFIIMRNHLKKKEKKRLLEFLLCKLYMANGMIRYIFSLNVHTYLKDLSINFGAKILKTAIIELATLSLLRHNFSSKEMIMDINAW